MSTAVRVQALFGKGAKTATKKASKKSAPAPKKGGVPGRKGWLGEQEVDLKLEKWYGKNTSAKCAGSDVAGNSSVLFSVTLLRRFRVGGSGVAI